MATDKLTLSATLRDERGSNAMGRLRSAGQVPAVVYGDGMETAMISVGAIELERVCDHPHIIVLDVTGEATHNVLIKDIQRDPLRGTIRHADFLSVDMSKPVMAEIPLVPDGDAKGTHRGGDLDQAAREITVQCLPADLPEEIHVDVSGLDLGQSMSLGEVPLPEGVTGVFADPNAVAFQVVAPRSG